jgi:cyclohexanecarboxyl-CoA dehydrogenase
MAGFGFSEEEELFRRQIREFAQKELAPGAKERNKRGELDLEMIKKMSSIGLMSMNAPAKYGGTAASWVNIGIAVEELAKVDFSMGYYVIGTPGFLSRVLSSAHEEVQSEWYPRLLNGDVVPSLCLTEPDCGSDAAAIKTRAVREGDYYVISGEKTSVSDGMQAEIAAVFAKTDPAAGAKGVSCILVPLTLPGITRSALEDMGWIPMRRASIIFDGVRIPTKYRIGEEGQGFYIAMDAITGIRVCLSLLAIGKAEGALEEAVKYAKERTAFGRPIARFEAISFKIAEQATILEAARLLCYRALWLKDQGIRNMKEAAMAKWYGARMAVMAIHEMLLIYGHIGYTTDYPVEQHLRDVIGNEIGDGTAEIMKLIISREIMGRGFEPL